MNLLYEWGALGARELASLAQITTCHTHNGYSWLRCHSSIARAHGNRLSIERHRHGSHRSPGVEGTRSR